MLDPKNFSKISFEKKKLRVENYKKALTLHNIPEGLLTYVSSLSENPGTGRLLSYIILYDSYSMIHTLRLNDRSLLVLKSNRPKDWELHAPLVFIIFLKDSLLLCQFISEQNQKQKDYFMPVSLVSPNHLELLSVFLFLVMVVPSKL